MEACDLGSDNIVEMGFDNVKVIGERQVCAALGITHPPNAVESSLMVTRSASSVDVNWAPPPIDASHDGAAYYQVWVSNQPLSDFAVERTTAGTSLVRSPLPFNEYYLVIAVNAAGTSGDEPTP